jgi:plastocyanin
MPYSRLILRSHNGCRNRIATQFALGRIVPGIWITLLCLAAVYPDIDRAAELSASVIDRQGHGVGEVVITVSPESGTVRPTAVPGHAVMDQLHRAFVPLVLAVAVGTSVDFPNNDSVSHEVYSFSPAKRFQLPLYKGEPHLPVVFDRAGLVVLGCNIHDQMVGYIYVTDAPYFGTTQADGSLRLKGVAAGNYNVTFWSPLVADAPERLTWSIHVDEGAVVNVPLQLTSDLRGRPEPRPGHGDWEY